jgi:hypothetical protein
VAIGSSYFHLQPDTDRLFWDRLPMTLAFMGITTAIIRDRIDGLAQQSWLLPVLVLAGIGAGRDF